MRFREDLAVSEIIGLTLVLLIASTVISALLFWGMPYMADKKAYVAAQSALFQFDAVQDLIDKTMNEGAFDFSASGGDGTSGNSKKLSLTLSAGQLFFNEESERFVLWYPLYKTNEKKDIFYFYIKDFKTDIDPFTFTIVITGIAPGHVDNGDLLFHAENLFTDEETDFSIECRLGEYKIRCVGVSLSDAVKVDINFISDSSGPGDPPVPYGRIWMFDIGSIRYKSAVQSDTYQAIVENTCVISAHNQVFTGFFNEPRYWPKTLLNGSDMVTLGFLQIKPDAATEGNTIDGNGNFEVEMSFKQDLSFVRESKERVYGDIGIKMYGDEAAISAWRFYYTQNLDFTYDENKDMLSMPYGSAYLIDGKCLFLSLYHGVCNVGMSVKK